MAKADLLKDAKKAGLVPDDASADDFTEAQLRAMLDPEESAGGGVSAIEGSLSDYPFSEAPDGHKVK